MVPAGLFILSMLVVCGSVAVIGHYAGGRTAPGMRRGPVGAPGAIPQGSKQHGNTCVAPPPVHMVPPAAPCWPGVWVGPAAAAQPVLDYGGIDQRRLVQRRRPSSISARISAHGVLR